METAISISWKYLLRNSLYHATAKKQIMILNALCDKLFQYMYYVGDTVNGQSVPQSGAQIALECQGQLDRNWHAQSGKKKDGRGYAV